MPGCLYGLGDLNRLDHIPSSQMWDSRTDGSKWRRGDLEYFKNNADRIRASLDRLPFNLNVYIASYAHRGTQNRDQLIEVFEERLGRSLADPQAISVILSHNITGGTMMPMTPWMIVHRMAHAWQFARHRGHFDTLAVLPVAMPLHDYMQAFIPYWKSKSQICRSLYEFYLDNVENLKLSNMIGALMTTRAARNCELLSEVDIDADLFAQYVFCGGIRLLPFEQWDKRLAALEQRLDAPADPHFRVRYYRHALQLMREVVNPQEIDQLLRDTEAAMNARIAQVIETMRGDVWTF